MDPYCKLLEEVKPEPEIDRESLEDDYESDED